MSNLYKRSAGEARPERMKRNSHHVAWAAAVVLFFGQAVKAADNPAGSLENIWAEQGQTQQSPQSEAAAGSMPITTSAPMCTLEDFQKSALAQKGGWPGIGPF